jgi:DNA topoisomerase-1
MITANVWRFGPYVKRDNLFCSIPKDAEYNIFSISIDQAISLVKDKKEKEGNKYINTFKYEKEEIQVLNWMYWPYIKYGKKNYKIPKWWKDATDLTLDDCLTIIWDDINKDKQWKATKKPIKKRSSKK